MILTFEKYNWKDKERLCILIVSKGAKIEKVFTCEFNQSSRRAQKAYSLFDMY